MLMNHLKMCLIISGQNLISVQLKVKILYKHQQLTTHLQLILGLEEGICGVSQVSV